MKEGRGLSAGALKGIAAGLMAVDHAGLFLCGNALWMRAAGRLAFPIFAFFIAEGARRSRRPGRYLGRLLGLAALSQPAFSRVVSGVWLELSYLNTLFTLALGLLAILWSWRAGSAWPALVLMLAAELLGTDYGAAGVLTVWLFDRLQDGGPLERTAVPILAGAGLYCLPALVFALGEGDWNPVYFIELLAAGAAPLLMLYNGERGRGGRWFYWFYPGHLLGLLGVGALGGF